MYAVVGYLDKQTEQNVKSIGNELFEQNITDYATGEQGYRPHITFASFEEIDVKVFATELELYFSNCKQIQLTFPSLGIFLNTGILYLAPRVSESLLHFHKNFHDAIEPFKDGGNSLYSPENWVPHCTITAYLNQEQLLKAVEHCNGAITPLKGTISEVGLIKVNFNDEDKVTGELLSVISLKEDS
ncbi:2'-5' RNA ligase family protein [Alkalihalobacillus sp. AL-G]|uniref:2'-5' RNA ligase family protein n=1 Tax=Alkalihalobacillus sp. AL-G TaxID=2926399 RepID=UPI00272C3A6E|nr:2'-5' RNA ligase family protein [Alkalihalobacillus sp. AL-G]WLD93910.1 2'-5' RNA ligase family protein [Alkalihalobacillus sp. AL-G]